MLHRSSAAFLALAVTLAFPSASQAQGRDVYKLPMPRPAEMAAAVTGRTQPGVAASSPIGFGPGRGDVFAGLGYQNSSAVGTESDGSLSAGMGFFDPRETAGLEFVLTSLSTVRAGFGSRMVAGLKVHKALERNIGVGVGVEGIKINGDDFDTDPSIYIAATQVRMMREGQSTFNQMTFNLGLGTGRFQSADAFADGESGVGVFAGAALRINWFSSAIVDYTGAAVNLAASFTPSRTLPLVITPSINDLSGAAGDAGRLALGVGFSWKY
jgi:hypothetical protein